MNNSDCLATIRKYIDNYKVINSLDLFTNKSLYNKNKKFRFIINKLIELIKIQTTFCYTSQHYHIANNYEKFEKLIDKLVLKLNLKCKYCFYNLYKMSGNEDIIILWNYKTCKLDFCEFDTFETHLVLERILIKNYSDYYQLEFSNIKKFKLTRIYL